MQIKDQFKRSTTYIIVLLILLFFRTCSTNSNIDYLQYKNTKLEYKIDSISKINTLQFTNHKLLLDSIIVKLDNTNVNDILFDIKKHIKKIEYEVKNKE